MADTLDPSELARAMAQYFATDPQTRRNPLLDLHAGLPERQEARPYAAQWGGLKSYLPERMQPPEMARLQRWLGQAMNAVPKDVQTLATFIGPAGAGNLARANLRHPDDWGGLHRLKAAQADEAWGLKSPDAQRHIWEKYGWTPPETWGTYGMWKKGAQPATEIATPDFAVNQAALRPMKEGRSTVHLGEGKVPDLLQGMDEVLAAEPSLRDVPLSLRLDPNLKTETGSTTPVALWKDGAKRIGEEPIGWRTGPVQANGYDIPSLTGTAAHEVLGHATMIPQGVAPTLGIDQRMMPLRGSPAERDLAQHFASKPEAEAMHQQMAAEARTRAGYLALTDEQAARIAQMHSKLPLEEIQKRPPGLEDTYQLGALGAGLEAQMPFPLSHYRPPWLAKD